MKVDASILETWEVLNNNIKNKTEEELKALLNVERKGKKRTQFLLRIYGRYNTMRTVRERRELMAETAE